MMLLAQFRLYPEQASTYARRVDDLFDFLTLTTGTVTVVIAVLIVFFALKYRRSGQAPYQPRIKGSLPLETAWIVFPTILFLLMFGWGARLYLDLYAPPAGGTEIFVVGKQWMWKVQHPDGQREINQLHVPVGEVIKLRMISEDVVHSLYIPAFRIKHDVLPDRYSTLWFQATRTGTFHLFCTEYCGTGHSQMIGQVVVLRPSEYRQWLTRQAEGSLALEGRKTFLHYRCISCHNTTGRAHGPTLEDLFQHRVLLADGSSVIADENYLRESILRPRAKIVAGFQPVMPSYQGQITEEEILQLLAYIRSLTHGEMPTRVEQTPPPFAQPPESAAPQEADE